MDLWQKAQHAELDMAFQVDILTPLLEGSDRTSRSIKRSMQ